MTVTSCDCACSSSCKTRYTPECSTVSPGLYSLPMALPFKMELGLARLFRRLLRQPTAHELRNFWLFSRPLPVPLAPPYGPNFPISPALLGRADEVIE